MFWRTALAAELEYRANAWIELLSVLGHLAGSLFVLSLLYQHGRDLGGWSWNQALVVLGISTLLDGFTTVVLQPNLSKIVSHVQNGTLDYVLVKPIDSQLWLSTRQISPWGLPGIIVGVGLSLWGVLHSESHHHPVSPGEWISHGALSLVLVLCAAAILYSLWFLLASLSIWFVKVWNATEVLRSTLVAGRYPVSAYPAALRLVFTLVLPITFLTSVPAEALLGRASTAWTSGSLLAAVLAVSASRMAWLRALRHYTSASS